MAFEVFTPGETLAAIGYAANEGALGPVGAVWTDVVWDRGDTPSSTLLCQIGDRDRAGLPATTLCWGRCRGGRGVVRLVGRL